MGRGGKFQEITSQEMEAEADAQADFRSLRYRSEVGLNSVREEVAEVAHPLPECQLMPSDKDPLQSEDHSNIHSNFAAVQNIAKPVAQLDADSVSSITE